MNGKGQTTSHSELFALEGQKRASTTTVGAGVGPGIIGISGHVEAAKGDGKEIGASTQSTSIGGMKKAATAVRFLDLAENRSHHVRGWVVFG